MVSTRIPLLAALILLAQACASTRAVQDDAPVADQPTLAGRTCLLSPNPARLPAAGELVDAAAFGAAAVSAWAAAGRPQGHVLFSIRHSADGTQVRRAVIETSVPRALADTLQKLVFAYRRAAAPAAAEWGVRLRVELGQVVALSVARRVRCTARPREWEYRTAGSPFDVREGGGDGVANATVADASVVWVHVTLDDRGNVTEARVERGTGRPAAEQRLLYYVRSMAFVPATEDGYPVPGEMTLPLRLATPL